MTSLVLEGRVFDEKSRPVGGATVYVAHAPVTMPDVALLTDAAGRFSLTVPTAGTYRVAARMPNGSTAERTVTVDGNTGLLELHVHRS